MVSPGVGWGESPTEKATYLRAWRAANPDKAAAQVARRRLKQYGLTPERYAEIWLAQEEACGICGRTDSWRWSIDHDHACCAGGTSCGACVRGVLCQNCNAGIAQFRDDPQILAAAIAYVGGA